MTENFSILDLYGKERDPETIAPFFKDLNISQILDKLSQRWGKNVRKYYRCLPGSAEEAAYRRAVYSDTKKEEIYRSLMDHTEAMEEVKSLRSEKEKVSDPTQKAVWQIREICAYCSTNEKLERRLSEHELSSEGMLSFLHILRTIIN
ncbi:MAG: hypothetical protein J6X66_12205, partial [Lachnospiraceae bacterium]|nr:hypothetical protein [Lachnospiraceae bacterium]